MRYVWLLIFGFHSFFIFAQENEQRLDTLQKPIINIEKDGLFKNIDLKMNMRLSFHNHSENGREDNYTEFRHLFAFEIGGWLTDKVGFQFRNRFNREAVVQTLDKLDGSVELAYVDIKATPKTRLQFGKMFAYFGGYEYEFNPTNVLEYNDIQRNLLNYVTGVGITHKVTKNHQFGFQALNSRTMRYEDIYEGNVSDNVQEPKWPLALVVNWRGSFFDGKLETIYSYSRFRVAKGHGTTKAITLGHKIHLNKWTVLYDFNYSKEQLDTKGIVTEILGGDNFALDAIYKEHWMRTEYQITPSFSGLLTLMTSNAYTKSITEANEKELLRASYGIISTLLYQPFSDLDIKFYAAYIGRAYKYSDYSKSTLGIRNYVTNEIQLGIIAPIHIF